MLDPTYHAILFAAILFLGLFQIAAFLAVAALVHRIIESPVTRKRWTHNDIERQHTLGAASLRTRIGTVLCLSGAVFQLTFGLLIEESPTASLWCIMITMTCTGFVVGDLVGLCRLYEAWLTFYERRLFEDIRLNG